MSSSKGHHRTCSTPIRFLPAYEDDQENAYVHAASRLSDSDSSSNEQSHQHMFVNSKILNDNQKQEVRYKKISFLLYYEDKINLHFSTFDFQTITHH